MEQKILVIITTTDTMDDARRISRALVEMKFAACVQLSQITSIYRWDGTITEDNEVRLMIKAVEQRKDDIVQYLNDHHPYSTPEIIITPFDAEKAYYEWCQAVSS